MLKSAVSPAAGLASVQRVADAATKVINADPNSGGGQTYVVLPVQRPAEIANYQATAPPPASWRQGWRRVPSWPWASRSPPRSGAAGGTWRC